MAVALMNGNRRTATVEVFTKKLEDGSAGSFGTVGGMCAEHWGAMIKFEDEGDDLVYVCESNPNDDNLVTPSFARKRKQEIVRGAKVFKVGKIRTNPQELQLCCNQVSLNWTRYNVIANNCQKWVIEFLNKFGLKFDHGWFNAETGVWMGLASGAALIGGLIWSSRSRNRSQNN